MSDLADPSASERLAAESRRAISGFGGLHLATKIVVIAASIHLLSDVIKAASTLLDPSRASVVSAVPLETVANVLSSVGYSLSYFSGAATVEFLFRIWGEVRRLRETEAR